MISPMQNDTDQFETNPKETHRMAMNKPRVNLRKRYHYHNENHRLVTCCYRLNPLQLWNIRMDASSYETVTWVVVIPIAPTLKRAHTCQDRPAREPAKNKITVKIRQNLGVVAILMRSAGLDWMMEGVQFLFGEA